MKGRVALEHDQILSSLNILCSQQQDKNLRLCKTMTLIGIRIYLLFFVVVVFTQLFLCSTLNNNNMRSLVAYISNI